MESPGPSPNPYAPPQATVQDIADPSAAFQPGGRGIRLLATIVDGIVFSILVYVPFLMGGAGRAIDVESKRFDPSLLMGTPALFALIGLVVWAWLTILFVRRNGQTIAKKLFGIKVVMSNGAPISLARIFWLRNVVNGVLGIIPLYGIIDALVIFGESRRCVHDRIADTIVVKA
jgi:uncharacterized RDD family membrane protein YckC